jgi:hypothetical protein
MTEDDDFLVGTRADDMFNAILATASNSLDVHITAIEQASGNGKLTQEDLVRLVELIPTDMFSVDAVGADFDMQNELGMQHRLVNAMRNQVLTGLGTIRKDVSLQEAKQVLDSCRAFGEVIHKNMKSVVNLKRLQALESAILEAVSGSALVDKQVFLDSLERHIELYCKD